MGNLRRGEVHDDLLAKLGIKLRNTAPGERKTLCPKCSHSRRNRRDPCLSVRIEPGGVKFNCHNCGYGGINDGTVGTGNGVDRGSRARPGTGGKAWSDKLAGSRWW
jgi:hypothetical protein